MTHLPRVALVMKSLQAQFFQVMQAGAEDWARTHAARVALRCSGTESQSDLERQVPLVDEAVAAGIDALVLVPIDSRVLVPPVLRAQRAGVTVVNIDIALDATLLREAGAAVDFVGPDNRAAARRVGEVLAGALPPGAAVLMIEGLAGADNAEQRRLGFMDAISARGLTLAGRAAADWETDRAGEQFSALLSRHPGVRGVFCANDAMALGVIEVLAAQGLAGQVPVVGFDNDPAMRPHLASGALCATADAFAAQMAVRGIEHALARLAGAPAGGCFDTPVELVRAPR